MSDQDDKIDRRTVLKNAGIGALGATTALTQSVAAREQDATRRERSAADAKQFVTGAASDDAVQAVRQSIKSEGFVPRMGHAHMESLSFGDRDDEREGVIIPLKERGQGPDHWDGLETSSSIEETIGFLVIERREGSPSASLNAAGFILGLKKSAQSAASLLKNSEKDTLSLDEVCAITVITPDATYTDSVGDKSVEINDGLISTQNHTVQHCYFRNNDIIEHVDDIILCGACVVPGNGLGVGDVLECLYCIYQEFKAACIVGYCMDESGGSVGQTWCSIVTNIATTPIYFLPFVGSQALHFTAMAAAYGCYTDDPWDCTAPLADPIFG